MNLKYYLKGLGLGIIITALVLGIHHKVTDKGMTDAQVRARAEELGMVDGNSRLVNADDDVTAEDLLESIDKKNAEDSVNEDNTASEEETAAVTENKDTDVVESDDKAVQNTEAENSDVASDTEEKKVELENTRIDAVTDAEDDPDRTKVIEEKPEPETETTVAEEEKQAEEDEDRPVMVTGGTVLTINSGDSSDKVARKLVDLGLVLDASEYDTFLCTYGYDRLIRVGTYTIPAGASNDDIAKIITGR